MRRKGTALAIALSLAGAAALALAQQQTKTGEQEGGYTVCSVDKGAVLLEIRSGKTWLLTNPSDKSQPSVWLPAKKIDRFDEAEKWRVADRERGLDIRERSDLARQLSELRQQRSRLVTVSNDPLNLEQLDKRIEDLQAKLNEHK
jgi:hypothetical protein